MPFSSPVKPVAELKLSTFMSDTGNADVFSVFQSEAAVDGTGEVRGMFTDASTTTNLFTTFFEPRTMADPVEGVRLLRADASGLVSAEMFNLVGSGVFASPAEAAETASTDGNAYTLTTGPDGFAGPITESTGQVAA